MLINLQNLTREDRIKRLIEENMNMSAGFNSNIFTMNPVARLTPKLLYDAGSMMSQNESTHLFDDTEFVLEQLSKRYGWYLISNIATPYKECFYNLGLRSYLFL